MILSCPECTARFMVPDDALRPKGRNVKCGKCEHRWFADPPPALDTGVDPEEAVPPPISVTPLDPEEQSSIAPRNLPAVAGAAQARGSVIAWGLLVAMLAVLGGVLWFGRAQLVAAVPAVQPIYQSIGVCVGTANPERAFRFSGKPNPSRAESGELVISGEIVRDSACATYVPDIIVEFLDTDKNVLQRSAYSMGLAALNADGPTKFSLKIAEWPDSIADINLLFTIPNVKS